MSSAISSSRERGALGGRRRRAFCSLGYTRHGQTAKRLKSSGARRDPADIHAMTVLAPTFANFPARLKALPNWVMWRYRPPKRAGQKWRKVPFQRDGRPADTTDASTWSTFEACCETYKNGDSFDGIGPVFDGKVGDDGLCIVGIDFDHCIEGGKLLEPARSGVGRLQTYTEISVSGTGIHCIALAEPGATTKSRSIEIYNTGRFFALTGAPWGEVCGDIRAAAADVAALVEEARAEKARDAEKARAEKAGKAKPPEKAAEIAADDGPAAIFDGIKTETPGEGIKDYWFNKLTPEQKDKVVHYALGVIAANTKMLELSETGGDNDDYFKLITALAVSGAPHAEEYFVEFASNPKIKGADSEETLRAEFARCKKDANANKPQADGLEKVDVGFLIARARLAGADLSRRALVEQGLIATNPVIAEMNQRYAAGFIGGKFRVARFEQHLEYPLQRLVEFFSKEDFLNGVINP
jgi:hypothetical protein